jgi:phage I-like protein
VTLGGSRLPPGARTLSVEIALPNDEKLPTEIRLFKAGANPTRKGTFTFDDRAAELVMAAYAEHGVDVAIDLEHLSLNDKSPNYDPDARGYGRLEMRGGELWLVAIKWNEDGAARIASRRQRFVSPAFSTDDRGRVVEVFNVAITSMPATDFAMPIAASAKNRGNKMDPKLCRKWLELVDAGAKPEAALVTLAIDPKSVAAMAKVVGAAPDDIGAVLAAVRSWLDEFTAAATGKKKEEPKAEEPKAEEPTPAAVSAKATTAELETLRSEMAKQDKLVAELKADRDARVAADYREATGRVVKLGGLAPHRAWADEAGTRPRPFLLAMSLDELRAWGDELDATGGRSAAPKPPVGAGALSEREMVICAETKCDPQTFAALKALRNAARH